jgi:ABC-type transport system involved in cytochrome c biogenesis ATPase subunit
MPTLLEFNPLKSIAIPNVGRVVPKGLVLVIGPNSAGKTQLLRDINGRMLGDARSLVVCEDIEISRPASLDSLLEVLYAENHIRRRVDANNSVFIDTRIPAFGGSQSNWSLYDHQVKSFFENPVSVGATQRHGASDKFLEHFGRSFIASLFLDRRLTVTNTVSNFDYETAFPSNELQSLYIDSNAKQMLTAETQTVFGRAIWIDNTRANSLCLRVGHGPDLPSAEERLEPARMREYRLIEDEGDGFKSYVAICLTLLLGQRPVVLIDEPEMCLHPPQAYALGRFIGKHGVSTDRATFVATHSSHILRGIIEESEQLEVIRLSRIGPQFNGRRVSREMLKASIEKPSTKAESVLDGLFAEAVTVVESEGDRLIYGTVWDKIASEFSHDIHFVSVGGLGGISDPCALYRNLKIPLCIAADLDVIRELGTFESILRAVAPAEVVQELVKDCRRIIDAVKALGPIFDEPTFYRELADITRQKFDWNDGKQLQRIRSKLSELSGGLSQTSRLKIGLDSLKSYPLYYDLGTFLNRCRSVGVFLVPVGELEEWVPDLVASGPSKTKKSEWANFAANRIRETTSRQDDVWDFVRQMATFQRDEGARLAGYPTRLHTTRNTVDS